jgi:hypothetical protein
MYAISFQPAGAAGDCILSKFIRRDDGQGAFTFDVSFPDTSGKRPMMRGLKLRKAYYTTRAAQEPSSWYLLQATPLREAQADEDQPEASLVSGTGGRATKSLGEGGADPCQWTVVHEFTRTVRLNAHCIIR